MLVQRRLDLLSGGRDIDISLGTAIADKGLIRN